VVGCERAAAHREDERERRDDVCVADVPAHLRPPR
jgi:hypothetical protein